MRNSNRQQMVTRWLLAATVFSLVGAGTAHAAFVQGTSASEVLFGLDDDTQANPDIQPAGAPNQSLDKTDIMLGGNGDDVMIGLGGSDTMIGGIGDDILVGGTEQGQTPNSDVMIGDKGNDVALWRGGDGSESFIGGQGTEDALIFGNIDRDGSNVPIVSPTTGRHAKTGLPTADVTNQGGFCTIERVQDPDFGFQFLVRFFLRATGNLAVTVRTTDVEQVYCTSQAGGQITFADLTDADPQFVVVDLDAVKKINPTVGRIIR